MSCNFQQLLAGGGDLSSSQRSSVAVASYLWPPSAVNVLPQVQINSTLTDLRPRLCLPPSAQTHTSATTEEVRASSADPPLNTALGRSLIGWLHSQSPSHHLRSPHQHHSPTTAVSLLCTQNHTTTQSNTNTHNHTEIHTSSYTHDTITQKYNHTYTQK